MLAIYAMGENSKNHSIDDRGVHDGRRIIWLYEMNDKTLNPFILQYIALVVYDTYGTCGFRRALSGQTGMRDRRYVAIFEMHWSH